MCRNIRVLFNFEPPATPDEIRAAALQYVRKVSGTTAKKPAKINQEAFDQAINVIAGATADLLASMKTTATPKNREEEAEKRRARSAQRFAR